MDEGISLVQPLYRDEAGNEYLYLNTVTMPELLDLYAMAFFPMADARDESDYFWTRPARRAVFTFDRFHISRSLIKHIKTMDWRVTINRNFDAVIHACATIRADTWINAPIESLYRQLHKAGHAHSVEVYDKNDNLIGGVYGLAQNGVFCGESMFSTQSNASSVALIALMAHLRQSGFTLCDTQFINDHLLPFGCHEITRDAYQAQLSAALSAPKSIAFDGDVVSTASLLDFAAFCRQSKTHTS